MSDKLKQTLVTVTWADGEIVEGAKLNGALGQLETAIEFLNKAVGDINNQQYPHTNQLSSAYQLSSLPSSGPSLGRLVGSANWLNPKRLGLVNKTITVDFVYTQEQFQDGSIQVEAASNNTTRSVFYLPYPPVILTKNYIPGGGDRGSQGNMTVAYPWDSGTWVIGAPSVGSGASDASGKLSSRETSPDTLNTNEYFVSEDGMIILYTPLDSGEGFSIQYNFTSIGDSFTGATLNVIPDLAQTATLCTVTDLGGGSYQIDLPTITTLMGKSGLEEPERRSYRHSGITAGMTGTPSTSAQCYLPEVLTTALSANDTIPEGYIYLWDEDVNQVLNGGTFTYQSSSRVNVSGLSLEASSDRYRVVVPGADLAHIVSNLRESHSRHQHSGTFDSDGIYTGDRIWHADLFGLGDEGDGTLPPLSSSRMGPFRNPHPQYLHRQGYVFDGTDDSGNRRNAMLGDLVLSQTDYTLGSASNSFRLYFGGGTSSNPRLYHAASTNQLLLSNTGLQFSEQAPVAPTQNTLYRDNIVKAKAHITTGSAPGQPAAAGGFNITTASLSFPQPDIVRITFNTALPSPIYAVLVTVHTPTWTLISNNVITQNTALIEIQFFDWSTGPFPPLAPMDLIANTITFSVLVC